MPLGITEQIIFDHIKANRANREFWDGKIRQLRTEGKNEDEVIEALSLNLAVIYNADGDARRDLEGLVDAIMLLTADYDSVAYALLGRDLRTEAVAAMIPAPPEWPEPYQVWHNGKQIGPFSYAEIRIKWADEELTSEDQVYHAPSGQWKPLQELAEPWTVECVAPENQTKLPLGVESYFLKYNGTQSGPYTAAQIREMWKDCRITTEHKYWSEGRNEYCPITDLLGDHQSQSTPSQTIPTKKQRAIGTKEKPIPIISASYIGVAMHASSGIDRLFGEGKWTKKMDYGDIHGLRCWVVTLEDGTTEEVWFDYAPAAALVARREAGEKVGILDSLPDAERKKLQKLMDKGLARGKYLADLRRRLKEGDKPEDETSAVTYGVGCGCCLVGLVGVAILIFASQMATRVWTVVIVVVVALLTGWISQVFDNRLKKKREKQASAAELVNREIDAAYAEYQRLNPGSYWPGTAGDAQSRAAHRKWWKDQNSFNIPGFD